MNVTDHNPNEKFRPVVTGSIAGFSTSEMEFLGHQFNKSLESFDPCYSEFLLLADFKKKEKQENSSLFMNNIL